MRAHVSAAGAKGQHGRRSVARVAKIFDQDSRRLISVACQLPFHLTGGEASGNACFETLLDIGPDINPARRAR